MPKIKKKDKEILVYDLISKIKSYDGLVLSDFQGLDVEKMTMLRRSLRKSGVYLKVVKNRLARIAFDGASLPEKAKETLKGRPIVVALITDPFMAAKDLVKFFEDKEINFSFKAGFISGREIDYNFLREIGLFYSKQDVYGKFVSILASPLGRFAITLNNIIQKLVITLNEVAHKRESEGS